MAGLRLSARRGLGAARGQGRFHHQRRNRRTISAAGLTAAVENRHRGTMTSAADLELSFYERFLFAHEIEPYPVQEQAFAKIFAGESVMVSVPTGTGKTLIAKAAIHAALGAGKRAVYTTPLRALTEEKYRELCGDFGAENVGFATGDYKENREAPIQVEVAEILWNRIFGDKANMPADVVVMDEGHYFNDFDRGYVWEQSIIGLDPRVQLIMLSATVGHADRFCHWVELTRRVPMHLIESRERRIPLTHEYREDYLIDVVRDLAHKGDIPAIVFVFGREACFDTARLLKSCRRFTSDEEKAEIDRRCSEVLLGTGASSELAPLLTHGIGIHHAGILPRYKQLVEELALERLIKFVVSTETIAAGINLPAKTVVFPSVRKYIRKAPRLLLPAEYHQMAGRAGRPQFDDKGLAITLAPEELVQELRKELKDGKKRGGKFDEAKTKKGVYARLRSEAQRRGDVTWDPESHAELVKGEPAELRSKTKITAEQILAVGLPDLAVTTLPGAVDDGVRADVGPAYMHLDIASVVDNLLLDDRERRESQRMLVLVTENLRAVGVVDEHGQQVAGELIGDLQGLDGLFIYFVLMHEQLDYLDCRALVEYLIDHDVIQKRLDRKAEDKKKEWIKEKLRELRADNPQVTWQDVEELYDREHPREPTRVELMFQRFAASVPHPEIHGGKRPKNVWARMEDEELGFMDFVDRERLAHEEGSLFSYLIRVTNFARSLADATGVAQFGELSDKVRVCLAVVDPRLAP